MTQRHRLVTGIRPTADMHIGNYLGAIRPAVERQDKFEQFLFIADLHAITTPYEPKTMPSLIKGVALDYIAGGIDPKKSILFIQSHVPAHVELMWLLNTITPVGKLQRMIQYKEFKQQYGHPQAGILNYPILMAADILAYKAEAVPVGDDQMQHLEITQDLANKFNNIFGATFPIPKNVVPENQALRIMSLNDPGKKMSKSLGPKSYIALSDNETTIRQKIASAVTDEGGQKTKTMSPGVKNLFTLLELTADQKTYQHMQEHYHDGKLKYSELKPVLADAIIDFLKPIQKRRQELAKDPTKIAKILARGSESAQQAAQKTLEEVKQKMGLL